VRGIFNEIIIIIIIITTTTTAAATQTITTQFELHNHFKMAS